MTEPTSAVSAWESFDVIVGSSGGEAPLFVIGGAALALLLVGIHNAWDTVTHIVVTQSESSRPSR
jgi:hypothetical protein